ncbi:MAG: hypothetical protein JWP01_1093 [Myxococcales bacterium]|nr:hypothetical protein [Myxococcales bacterium]
MKLAAAVLLVAALAAPVDAAPDCAREADRLRAHLEQASRNASRWTYGWAIAFGAAAAGQLTLALTEIKPFGTFDADYEETLYVGAAKASIGLLSRVVLPLRVHVPAPDADRCAELTALRAAVTTTAHAERRSFWLNHVGGFALNLAGAGLLWHRRSFSVGAISFAMSYPIGLLSAYTQPRKTWHLWRDEHVTWSTGVIVQPDHAMLTVAGAF